MKGFFTQPCEKRVLELIWEICMIRQAKNYEAVNQHSLSHALIFSNLMLLEDVTHLQPVIHTAAVSNRDSISYLLATSWQVQRLQMISSSILWVLPLVLGLDAWVFSLHLQAFVTHVQGWDEKKSDECTCPALWIRRHQEWELVWRTLLTQLFDWKRL